MRFRFTGKCGRWDSFPPEERKSGYWLVIPDDPDDCLDNQGFEIVYVYFDGRFQLRRPGIAGNGDFSKFLFVGMISERSE